jgi:DNA-binding PadR family transcriptional regulator
MFSPEKDLRDIILGILSRDPASISGVSRELEARGVKMHRLELTGYLKALADLNILNEKEIKPSKVFSISGSGHRSFHEMIGDACNLLAPTPDERATLAAYCLQRVFRRAVFALEVRRCEVDGVVVGRKATGEERAEAKTILVRLGYKVPNSDTPTVVEQDLDQQYSKVLAHVLTERFNMSPMVKETTQTKL